MWTRTRAGLEADCFALPLLREGNPSEIFVRLFVDIGRTRADTLLMNTVFRRLAMLREVFRRCRALLDNFLETLHTNARYTAVPVWRPWRDF